jgi:hypothetical protein
MSWWRERWTAQIVAVWIGTELARATARLHDGAAFTRWAMGWKTLRAWWRGGSEAPEFKEEDLLVRRRAALSDSARRQAAQLRADQEAGRSPVGPWAPATGSPSRHRPVGRGAGRILALVAAPIRADRPK